MKGAPTRTHRSVNLLVDFVSFLIVGFTCSTEKEATTSLRDEENADKTFTVGSSHYVTPTITAAAVGILSRQSGVTAEGFDRWGNMA